MTMASSIWLNVLVTSLVIVVMVVVVAGIYYIKNRKLVAAKKAHFKQIHQKLSPGSNVMLANGLYGTVVKLKGDIADIRVKSGTIIEVSRYAISEIIDERKNTHA